LGELEHLGGLSKAREMAKAAIRTRIATPSLQMTQWGGGSCRVMLCAGPGQTVLPFNAADNEDNWVVLAGIALLFVSVAQGLVPLLRVAGPMLGIPFTVDCVSLHRSRDGSLRTDVHMLLTRRGFDEVLLAMTYPN
jgi:hypothetical protein